MTERPERRQSSARVADRNRTGRSARSDICRRVARVIDARHAKDRIRGTRCTNAGRSRTSRIDACGTSHAKSIRDRRSTSDRVRTGTRLRITAGCRDSRNSCNST
ncbi:unannotated protein [freshwater metagenome]|uniref:Unannotated protein n=1 Tax=freshwater metagenome TaxID=449393 RepID=A0A6J6FBN6_9ZZZZ